MFAMEDAILDVGRAAIMEWRQQRDGYNRDKMTISKCYFKYETKLKYVRVQYEQLICH